MKHKITHVVGVELIWVNQTISSRYLDTNTKSNQTEGFWEKVNKAKPWKKRFLTQGWFSSLLFSFVAPSHNFPLCKPRIYALTFIPLFRSEICTTFLVIPTISSSLRFQFRYVFSTCNSTIPYTFLFLSLFWLILLLVLIIIILWWS